MMEFQAHFQEEGMVCFLRESLRMMADPGEEDFSRDSLSIQPVNMA